MKEVEFNERAAQKAYRKYIRCVERVVRPLSKEERRDIIQEFNSHFYEALQNNKNLSELETLRLTIEKLGPPERTLASLIADKKNENAAVIYHPHNFFSTLIFKLTKSIIYIMFSLLSLTLLILVILIAGKIVSPADTGLFYRDGKFCAFGIETDHQGTTEALGNWFIPILLIFIVVIYYINVSLLRIKKRLS